jgi:hypothetical protein
MSAGAALRFTLETKYLLQFHCVCCDCVLASFAISTHKKHKCYPVQHCNTLISSLKLRNNNSNALHDTMLLRKHLTTNKVKCVGGGGCIVNWDIEVAVPGLTM